MNTIEILKEMIGDYELLGLTAGINNKKKLYDAEVKRINALKEALLALGKLDRLEKWLKDEIEKRDLDAEHCFNENDVLTESLIQRQIDILKEVREVLRVYKELSEGMQ
jgi:hypothetical protein